ncbi:hypothetical protein D9M68_1001590 [compost metagenome]
MLLPALMMRTSGASSAKAERTAASSALIFNTMALAFWNQSKDAASLPSSAPTSALKS